PLTHTLSFSGEEKTFARIQELLVTIDAQKAKGSPLPPASQFYIYKPSHQSGDQIVDAIKEVAGQLKSDKIADPALLRTLGTMKWVKSTNSLMFTGDPVSLQKVQSLIATIDIEQSAATNNFYMYKLRSLSPAQMEKAMKEVASNLKSAGLADSALLKTIH